MLVDKVGKAVGQYWPSYIGQPEIARSRYDSAKREICLPSRAVLAAWLASACVGSARRAECLNFATPGRTEARIAFSTEFLLSKGHLKRHRQKHYFGSIEASKGIW